MTDYGAPYTRHMGPPDIKYARNGDVSIAYAVLGEGPSDLVFVSSTVKDLVIGSNLRFTDRGTRELKGVPGEWRLYALARAS
jgi:hypothetical protein